ncbi:ribosome maturation factor RimM [Chryseolinea sp. T2]|uniref:ribosome maturation factor RimM n=1 Tax=Chryseolinea sp. T2 TaxID=3129255 RepID=UPI003077CE99
MLKEDCFQIGFVQRTHGLKGELTCVISADLPEADFNALFIELDNRLIPYFIKQLSLKGDRALIQLEDVDSLEQAKGLVGKSLHLQKSLRPKLGRGEFYDDEIVGFIVTDQTLGTLGKIREMIDAGPNKLIAVEHNDKEVLIPVNGPFIKSINKSKKTVTVELPDGYLDM